MNPTTKIAYDGPFLTAKETDPYGKEIDSSIGKSQSAYFKE